MAVVGREEFSVPPAWVVLVLGALVFVTVAISGIDYILIFSRRALSHPALSHSKKEATAPRAARDVDRRL